MHTVIVGGGFAGIKAALELSKYHLGRITLISDRPYFMHHASLYSVATGHDPAELMVPLDDIFADHSNVTIINARLTSIDPDRNLAVCDNQSFSYDSLIMALGSVVSFDGVKDAEKHTHSTHNLERIQQIHSHLYDAITQDHHVDRDYVIVGGGPTGIELAAVLMQYIKDLSQLHKTKKATIRVTLVESNNQLLPNASTQASKYITRRLRSGGVSVLTGTKIKSVDENFVIVDGHKIPTQNVIWTAGNRSNPFYAEHPHYFEVKPNGLVDVNPYLEAYHDIYVLGDNIDVRGSGRTHGALDMAVFVADHLARRATGKPLLPYRASSSILAVSVGEHWAYIECFGVYVTGRIGKYIRNRIIRNSYRQIMPKIMADAAMQVRDIKVTNL